MDYDFRFPKDAKGNPLGIVMTAKGCDVSVAADGDLDAACRDLQRLQQPAPMEAIEAWLAELSVIVARRQDDEFAEELRVTAYAGRLRGFPADVVKQAVLRHTWKFWPSWHELEAVCKQLAAPRQLMIAAMKEQPKEPDQPRERVSAERAAEIIREVWGRDL